MVSFALAPPRLLAAAVSLALALPASASAAGFTAHLSAPDHTPKAGRNWPITVTARRGSHKLSGSVRYEFVFQGQVVSHQPGHRFKRGVYRDKLLWPAEAVGHKLTLRVVVKTRYGTDKINWAIRVHR
jgi:hypothetical protein